MFYPFGQSKTLILQTNPWLQLKAQLIAYYWVCCGAQKCCLEYFLKVMEFFVYTLEIWRTTFDLLPNMNSNESKHGDLKTVNKKQMKDFFNAS